MTEKEYYPCSELEKLILDKIKTHPFLMERMLRKITPLLEKEVKSRLN